MQKPLDEFTCTFSVGGEKIWITVEARNRTAAQKLAWSELNAILGSCSQYDRAVLCQTSKNFADVV